MVYYLQLLHEFNGMCEKDVVSIMGKNWKKVCYLLRDDDSEVIPSLEKLVLQKIERNIYHKKPRSLLPITFAKVRKSLLILIATSNLVYYRLMMTLRRF